MLSERFDISVRRGRPEDAAALVQVYAQSWRQAYTGIIPATHLDNEIRRRDAQWWARAIAAEDHLLVVSQGSALAGYATCGRSRGGRRDRGEIYELYISPVWQGTGLGTHLFEACRATLDQHGFRHLIVWALAENEVARNFYLSAGGRPSRRVCVRLGDELGIKIAFEW